MARFRPGVLSMAAVREYRFAYYLINARAALDMTQKQLADVLEISPQYLCDIESGRRLPTVEIVNKVSAWNGLSGRDAHNLRIMAARDHGWDV